MDTLYEDIERLRPADDSPSLEAVQRQRSALLTWIENPEVGLVREPTPSSPRRRGTRHRRPILAGVGAVAAAVALVVVLLPDAGPRPSPAAAAELQQIANNAAQQEVQQLGPTQWFSAQQQFSALARVYPFAYDTVQHTPKERHNIASQATITSTIQEWSNRSGSSCVSLTPSTPQFATPANQAAWHAAGFLDTPRPQALLGCAGTNGSVDGAIDVSALPTDPSVLARELSTGTTGIQGLDQLDPRNFGNSGGFERAVAILSRPTAGALPSFNAALYRALALIPGIKPLGDLTTRSGVTGLGFSAASPQGPSIVIIDPSNGRLVELRNAYVDLIQLAVVNAYEASFGMEIGAQVMVQWFDPVGTTTVVDQSAIPQSVTSQLP